MLAHKTLQNSKTVSKITLYHYYNLYVLEQSTFSKHFIYNLVHHSYASQLVNTSSLNDNSQ